MHSTHRPRGRLISPSTLICALLVACSAAVQPTPSETIALARGSLATLAAICARLPADAPAELARACVALTQADAVAAEACPEVVNPWPAGGAGGAP